MRVYFSDFSFGISPDEQLYAYFPDNSVPETFAHENEDDTEVFPAESTEIYLHTE